MKQRKAFVIIPEKTISEFFIYEPQYRAAEWHEATNEELLSLLELYGTKKREWGDPDAFIIDNEDADKETCYWIGQFHHALKHCGTPVRFTSKWRAK